MKIKLIVVGKTEEAYLREGIGEYSTRIGRYVPFEIIEIPAGKNPVSMPHSEQKSREMQLIDKHLKAGDVIVLLDEHGKEMRSVEFASFLNRQFLAGAKNLIFIVGGPFGFDDALKSKASFLVSLSKMTFSHQMVRLFFTEQLYRAMTILKGESYHHE